ncbi:hypothetical protein [Aestuariicoccus sp. MJ-SS9]|uniref:hypothetical protein n=1 Tax=Aestuariicoccus sp. MJ-SS9 TaxID=3079855 RepID=UPI002908EEEB|nr:hypothetical protein [Aestuariicoccus sp. MJ-SS9]MDU8912709.1 hypothetical protein [Aestuariicoccus sp. MJ-SS9]
MSKPAAFVMLLALAALCAGVFGALHNQLSYSVGASYFHDFKFAQFGIAEASQNRIGAAWVGWRASWWMGLLIGLPAFGLGLVMIGKPSHLVAAGIGAIGAVLFVTLLFAMGGLMLGMFGSGTSFAAAHDIPAGVTDRDSFLRAAFMHEGAYIGGLVGLLAALATMWRAGKVERRMSGAPA